MVLAGLKLKADMFMPYYEYCKIESLYEGIVRKGSYGNFYAGEDDFDVLEKLAYVRENRLAGVFTANLNGDDKKGLCKKGGMRFPLMSLVRQAFTGEYTYAFNKPVKETLQEIAAEKAKQDEEKAQTQLVHNETAALNEKNLETAQVEPKTQAEEHVWQTSNIEYGHIYQMDQF
uniref:Uncharacterized protein n=1 Tax=Ditylenchus dipsaci TaxID=166011 RepID=A0A915ERW2_9BILA